LLQETAIRSFEVRWDSSSILLTLFKHLHSSTGSMEDDGIGAVQILPQGSRIDELFLKCQVRVAMKKGTII